LDGRRPRRPFNESVLTTTRRHAITASELYFRNKKIHFEIKLFQIKMTISLCDASVDDYDKALCDEEEEENSNE